MTLAIFGIENSGLNLVVNLFILSLVVRLPGADRLDLLRRAPADRRPDAGHLRHAGRLLPVLRAGRLPDPQAAGVPRRRPRARARDGGGRGPADPAQRAVLPRTAITRSSGRSCCARAATASSRSPAPPAPSRSTRAGGSARTARTRSASPRPRRRTSRAAAPPPVSAPPGCPTTTFPAPGRRPTATPGAQARGRRRRAQTRSRPSSAG